MRYTVYFRTAVPYQSAVGVAVHLALDFATCSLGPLGSLAQLHLPASLHCATCICAVQEKASSCIMLTGKQTSFYVFDDTSLQGAGQDAYVLSICNV